MADFTAGDVLVKKIELVNHKGETIDLMGLWVSLEIFEDIMDSAISAKVYIVDGINLYERFPIIGHEKLRVHYLTPTMEVVKVEFVTFDVPEKSASGDNVFGYYLHCLTEDGLRARTSLITSPISGNALDGIKSILSTLDSARPIDADDLTNTLNFIPPRQRPFESINTICNRSFSSIAAETPDVIFYDTVDGYKVKSLYGLMKEEPVAKYSISDSAITKTEKTKDGTLYNIGNFSFTTPISMLARITGGSYGGTLGVFDVTRRKYTERKYGINSAPENFSIMNKESGVKVDSELIKSAQDSNFRYVIAGTKDHSLLERTARFDQLFGGTRMIADLPGNSSLRVGNMIYVSAPSPNPDDEGKDDKTLSGKYLIASIRHVMVSNDITTYRTVVELVRDSGRMKVG